MKSQGQHQPEKSSLPSTSPLLHFYPFADGGVLFLEGTRRIWALNAASAFLWCMIDQVPGIEGLAGAMAERFSIDMNTAMRDAKTAVARFEQEGLLGNNGVPDAAFQEEDDWDITPHGPPLVEPVRWAVRRLFETPNHVFELCCADSSMGEAFAGHMTHLSLNRPAAVGTCLSVLPDRKVEDTWDVYLDGRRYVGGVGRNEVLPYLSTLVFARACEALHERLLFHAAVIGTEGRAVLFPAEAGSGKSTLSAALAARGFRYFSDELAVLDLTSLRVIPFTLPMNIKSGSLHALERYYPALSGFPVHLRIDGKLVRYLQPPRDVLSDAKSENPRIQALVFPRYREGADTRLTVLEKADALQRLAWTGSSNREFTPVDVRAMIEVVEQSPCFELVFANLEEAISLLEMHVFEKERIEGE